MKSNVFQLSQVIKNIHRSKFYQRHTHWRKGFLESLLSKACGSFLFRQSEKTSGILWSVWVFYTYLEVMVIVWCDKVQIYREKQRFKMLVVLSPIFVADTKIIFGYDFVARLTQVFVKFFFTKKKFWITVSESFLKRKQIWL